MSLLSFVCAGSAARSRTGLREGITVDRMTILPDTKRRSREASMDSNRSGRRRFLERGAALAGLAVGAVRPASAQEGAPEIREVKPKGPYPYSEPSRFVTMARTNDYSKS